MYKNILFLIAFNFFYSTTVNAAKFGSSPQANDDTGSIIVGVSTTMTGNVSSNDSYGGLIDFTGSMSGQYGYLEKVVSDGSYTYKLFDNVTSSSIPTGETVYDIFTYTNTNSSNKKSTARLIIDLSVVNIPKPIITSNVDVEFNDRSWEATPLNSGKDILGNLYSSSDKDWYSLASHGDETISLELCSQGSSCFGKNSWVMYVFDSNRLTSSMETRTFGFSRWLDETGSTSDLAGQVITSSSAGSSNHMYLAYRAGFFEGALIGVIDPCFGSTNTLNIGVGNGPRNYLIAVSSPLRGNADGDGENECGGGSVVLEQPGRSALGADAEGKSKTYETTEEFISVFPNSDDQYSITVTGTGVHPLLSDDAAAKSATFDSNTGELIIPKVKLSNDLFQAHLNQQPTARSVNSSLRFNLSSINPLNSGEAPDSFQATYSSHSNQVNIPRVTDLNSGKAYSVVLLYHPATLSSDAWLELYSAKIIQ